MSQNEKGKKLYNIIDQINNKLDKAKNVIDQIKHRNEIIISKTHHRLLLTINGYRDYGWLSVMSLYRYIRDNFKENIDLIKLAKDQDIEGKWTLKIIIEFNGNREYIENKIKQRARTISFKPEKGYLAGGPSPNVKFEEIP